MAALNFVQGISLGEAGGTAHVERRTVGMGLAAMGVPGSALVEQKAVGFGLFESWEAESVHC